MNASDAVVTASMLHAVMPDASVRDVRRDTSRHGRADVDHSEVMDWPDRMDIESDANLHGMNA